MDMLRVARFTVRGGIIGVHRRLSVARLLFSAHFNPPNHRLPTYFFPVPPAAYQPHSPRASHHLDILSLMTLDQQLPRATPPRWLRFVDFRKNTPLAHQKST